MKRISICLLAICIVVLTACNTAGNKAAQPGHDMASMDKDTGQHTIADTSGIKTVAVTYSNIDPALSASMGQITDHYLHIKNALAKDDGSGAASGGSALEKAISKVDKSLFTADQKKTWDAVADEMKEDAEHISTHGDKIIHQRDHFASLSREMYTLVKSFGAGMPLYHDHCPMYNENKGGMWLSETRDIRNPYLGSAMPTCGSVEEVIQ